MTTQQATKKPVRYEPVFDAGAFRTLRILSGFTQEGLARELGVTMRTVQHWELRTGKPSALALRRLAEFFDRSTASFFEEEPERSAA